MIIGILGPIFSQNIDIEDYPPTWNGTSISNSISFLFPFKESDSFREACVYFEKEKNSSFIIMRYRVFPNYSTEQLYMKDTPTMMIKLGDGTVLTGKKERVVDGIVNASFAIDVYFNLNYSLQQKIIKYGIEKARIAYVYNYLGLNKNQIFDAFTKNTEMDGITIKQLLEQIQNANIDKVINDSKKNSLEYGF